MLSIEIKINGTPCVVINSHRAALSYGSMLYPPSRANYLYRGIVFPQYRDGDPEIFTGTVKGHDYDNGILELSKRILECVCDTTEQKG